MKGWRFSAVDESPVSGWPVQTPICLQVGGLKYPMFAHVVEEAIKNIAPSLKDSEFRPSIVLLQLFLGL